MLAYFGDLRRVTYMMNHDFTRNHKGFLTLWDLGNNIQETLVDLMRVLGYISILQIEALCHHLLDTGNAPTLLKRARTNRDKTDGSF